MKPRFSILTLLGITAYVGLVVASFNAPHSIARNLSIYADLGLLAYAAVVAATEGAKTPRGAFAGAFLGFAVAYSIVEVGPGRSLAFHGLFDLPHSHFVNLIVDDSLDDISFALTSEMLRIVATMHFSMIFNLLGGCLALWRYRRLERREQQERSG